MPTAVRFAAGLAFAACASFRPPARSSGPAVSRDGATIAVSGQACNVGRYPDRSDWKLVEEIVEVEVRSPPTAPLTIRREAFRLQTPDGYGLPTLTWGASTPIRVDPGGAQRLELRFMTHEEHLDCTKPMTLDPRDGVDLAGTPLAFKPITFTPRKGT